MILNGFIDDSYDDSVFVLAGYVAPADEWAAFSDKWQAALDTKPRISALKTSHAMRLKGDFHGWREEARDEKLRLLYEIIDAHVSFEVSSVIPMEPFSRIFRDSGLPKAAGNPYYCALASLISGVARQQIQIGMPEKIDFVFDEQVMEQTKVLQIWSRLVETAPSDVKPMLGSTPVFKNDRDVLPLQAADMEAWWLRQRWKEKLTGIPRREYPWQPANIGGVTNVYTEEKLVEFFQKNIRSHEEEMKNPSRF